MKKLNLSNLSLSNSDVLTRDQLKKVLGGGLFLENTTGGGRGGGSYCECYCCPDGGPGGSCPSGWYVAALCKG